MTDKQEVVSICGGCYSQSDREHYLVHGFLPARPLTETEEFAMLLCQAAWEVGGNDSDRLGRVQELLAAYGSNHPLPALEEK